MTSDRVIRIAIADDHELMRSGLALLFESVPDIEVVGLASNGEEALAIAERLQPDVILMDVQMPVLDGISATAAITKLDAGPRVLILTTFENDAYVFDALHSGASGFLLKRTEPDSLLDAVRVVAEGSALLSPSVTQSLIEEFVSTGRRGRSVHSGIESLTRRETEILVALAQGLSNAEIADELVIAESTVKTHIKRVLMKLGARDRVQAVIAAYEAGLV